MPAAPAVVHELRRCAEVAGDEGSEMECAEGRHVRVMVAERTRVAAAALAALVHETTGRRPAVATAQGGRCDGVLAAATRQRAGVVLGGPRALGQPEALARALRRQGCALITIVDPGVADQELRLLAGAGVTLLSSAADVDELRRALRSVAAGRGFVSADLALGLEAGWGAPRSGGWPALSAREHSVARLLSEGADRKAISALLGVSPKTVSTYRCRVMRKLRLVNEVQLARLFHSGMGARERPGALPGD